MLISSPIRHTWGEEPVQMYTSLGFKSSNASNINPKGLAIIGLALLRVISSKASASSTVIALPTTNIFSRKGWILGGKNWCSSPILSIISPTTAEKAAYDDGKQFSVILPFGCWVHNQRLKVLLIDRKNLDAILARGL
jgi:hypothetical protein